MFVCWAHGWAVQKTAEQIEVPFWADSCGSKELCSGWRSRSSTAKGNFVALPSPLRNIGNLCWGVCSKRDHSILNSGMTARLCSQLQWSRMIGVTLYCPPWKIYPVMRPFVKILLLLVYNHLRWRGGATGRTLDLRSNPTRGEAA